MTKEMADLNAEFDTANAFTKWKFMQTPEFASLPDAVRYTVEKELRNNDGIIDNIHGHKKRDTCDTHGRVW